MLKSGILSLAIFILSWQWFTTKRKTNENFRGKNVVICGGSTGIGEEIAYRFCEQGANVLVAARRKRILENVVKHCTQLGATSASYFVVDFQDEEDCEYFHKETLKRLENVDVLVLNHIHYEVKRWGHERKLVDARKSFEVNVLSYIHLTTLFLPSLKASQGRLLVISSGLGLLTYPYFTLYCSNKHALHGFFNALRQELAIDPQGRNMSITISVLGAIETDNALEVASGNPIAGPNGWTRSSPVDAARVSVQGSLYRERQVYFPKNFLKLHDFFSNHFPELTEWYIRYTYGLN